MRVDRSRTGSASAREADKSGKGEKGKGKAPLIPFIDQLADVRERMSKEELDRFFGDLDEAGNALIKNPSRENLDRYKNILRRFMQAAVALAFKAEKKTVFNRRKGFETRVINQIDEAVKDLTNEVLQANRRPIRILQKIGEIRGLLVDAVL